MLREGRHDKPSEDRLEFLEIGRHSLNVNPSHLVFAWSKEFEEENVTTARGQS